MKPSHDGSPTISPACRPGSRGACLPAMDRDLISRTTAQALVAGGGAGHGRRAARPGHVEARRGAREAGCGRPGDDLSARAGAVGAVCGHDPPASPAPHRRGGRCGRAARGRRRGRGRGRRGDARRPGRRRAARRRGCRDVRGGLAGRGAHSRGSRQSFVGTAGVSHGSGPAARVAGPGGGAPVGPHRRRRAHGRSPVRGGGTAGRPCRQVARVGTGHGGRRVRRAGPGARPHRRAHARRSDRPGGVAVPARGLVDGRARIGVRRARRGRALASGRGDSRDRVRRRHGSGAGTAASKCPLWTFMWSVRVPWRCWCPAGRRRGGARRDHRPAAMVLETGERVVRHGCRCDDAATGARRRGGGGVLVSRGAPRSRTVHKRRFGALDVGAGHRFRRRGAAAAGHRARRVGARWLRTTARGNGRRGLVNDGDTGLVLSLASGRAGGIHPAGGRLAAAADTTAVYLGSGGAVAVDLALGRERWRTALPAATTPVAVAG